MDKKVSIIMPFYGVEEYIAESLESVLNQNLDNYEVLMVNDGSLDGSREIAANFAQQHSEFKVIDQENAGPGAARNHGIDLATGDYIIFADPDDIVPPNAYKKLLSTIVQTDSQITAGNIRRFNSRGQRISKIHAIAFQGEKLKTNLLESPELIYDSTSWNKVYNAEFLKRHNIRFAEGIMYEDIPFTNIAYMLADSVDVIEATVYNWRARESVNKSITQDRVSLNNLADRTSAMNIVKMFIKEHQLDEEFELIFDQKMISFDFWIYIKKFTQSDDEYKKYATKDINDYAKNVNKIIFEKLSTQQRIVYAMLKDDKVDDVADYLDLDKKHDLEYTLVDNHLIGPESKYLSESIEPGDLPINTTIEKVEFNENNKLLVSGYAYLQSTNMSNRSDVMMKFELVDNTGNVIDIPIDNQIIKRTDVTETNLRYDSLNNYDYSGFEINIDLDKALIPLAKEMFVQITLNVAGYERKALLNEPIKGKVTHPIYNLHNDKCFYVSFNDLYNFRIIIEHEMVLLDNVTKVGKNIKFKLSFKTNVLHPMLVLTSKNTGETYQSSTFEVDNQAATIVVPFNIFTKPDNMGDWSVEIVSADLNKYENQTKRVSVIADRQRLFKHLSLTGKYQLEVDFAQDQYKGMVLNVQPVRPYVSNVKLKMFKRVEVDLVLSNKYMVGKDIIYRMVILDDGQTRLELPLHKTGKTKTNTKYKFQFSMRQLEKFDNKRVNVWIESRAEGVDYVYRARLKWNYYKFEPLELANKKTTAEITRAGNNLTIRLDAKWSEDEDTPQKREKNLLTEYPKYRELPLEEKTIVFDSLWATDYNDSPRAMSEYIQKHYPEYKIVWFLKNIRIDVPDGVIKVRHRSKQYWYYLATAKYLVQNTNFPEEYEKRSGQIEMETFHGTFLKKMGFDEPLYNLGSNKRQRDFQRRIDRWDLMLTPSPYMEETATKGYRYHKDVIHSGFPRNDELYTNNRPDYIDSIKTRLNIPKNKKVLLYAPTYRTKGKFSLELDLDALKAKLSDEWVILIRVHYFVASKLKLKNMEGFAYNVSKYPDINDLFLVSDVLMTDYSSVMFDYAHLKRPMIFFAYDLDYYENKREIYLDYKKEMPGPIVNNTDAIIDVLTNLSQIEKSYDTKYQQFYEKFAVYGRDGNSTEIAVKALLNKF